MSLTTWLAFLAAAILIAVTPGPGAVISISTGMRYGYWAALRAILGLQTAIALQIVVVALGMGALLATSEMAFTVVKLLGASYLIGLGIQKWRAPVVAIDEQAVSWSQAGFYRQGILINLTNPKAILFIAAFVPQFVDHAQPLALQYALITLTLCLTDSMVMSGYALLGSRLGRWLHDPVAIRNGNRVFGALFITAGGFLAGASRVS